MSNGRTPETTVWDTGIPPRYHVPYAIRLRWGMVYPDDAGTNNKRVPSETTDALYISNIPVNRKELT